MHLYPPLSSEYLGRPPTTASTSTQVYTIIGGVVGGVMLLVFITWLAVHLHKRPAPVSSSPTHLHPDSEVTCTGVGDGRGAREGGGWMEGEWEGEGRS